MQVSKVRMKQAFGYAVCVERVTNDEVALLVIHPNPYQYETMNKNNIFMYNIPMRL